ncbi:MAG: type II toxin-antitoxin system HicA family toxin [Candidatus Omnitrophica bacterium]|jgi:hypothetical protein|nr:type II toxin-antitoxin system HicA family toxin [Candidatus Omnitrophota bacterium]
MPNPIERDRIISQLTIKKNFREEEKKGHKLLRLYVDGKKTGISTSISRSPKYKEYGVDLLKWMARGLRLSTTSQLIDLIECPMTYEQYINWLRNNKGLHL